MNDETYIVQMSRDPPDVKKMIVGHTCAVLPFFSTNPTYKDATIEKNMTRDGTAKKIVLEMITNPAKNEKIWQASGK